MKRERLLNTIGITLLLICFAIALIRVFSTSRAHNNPDEVVVRFAHWQLESGIRDAFEVIARDYERTHPGVRIEQLTIPERIYASWLKTQLIGGTAPDLIELGQGTEDEQFARFFLPLTEYMELPNPYNKGSAIEKLRWRDTFLDGLVGGYNYRPNLLEYYGVPISMFTVRMYYNRTLWKELLGDTPVPADYDAFIAICKRIKADPRNILPISGSRYNAPLLINRLFSSQTQLASQELNESLNLKPLGPELGLQYLNGRLSVHSPAFVKGLDISRDVGQFLQPGFMQLGRDDATFYFVQGRALMITTGSWDAPSFRAQAPFEIGAFEMPLPRRDNPRFGAGVFGQASEGDISTGLSFGLIKQSPHRREALDFLQYVTSQIGNTTFTRVSGWLPAVVGVELAPDLKPFKPLIDGYVDGFDLGLKGVGTDTRRVVESNLNQLMNPNVELSSFQNALTQDLPVAMRSDLMRTVRNQTQNLTRQDTLLASHYVLKNHAADADVYQRKIDDLTESQTQQDSLRAWILLELKRTAK